MTYTLSQVRDAIRLAVGDPYGDLWDNDALDRALAQALAELSQAAPILDHTTLDAEDDVREYALYGVCPDLLSVAAVLYPYDPEDPMLAEAVPYFTYYYHDRADLYLHVDVENPDSTYDFLIYYYRPQRIATFQGATDSTLSHRWLEELVIEGAAAHAIEQRAVSAINVIGYTDAIAEQYRREADRRLRLFYAKLATIKTEFRTNQMPSWRLDKWDVR